MVDLFEFKVPEKDKEVFNTLVNKMMQGYDFRDSEKFEALSKEEQYLYIGYTFGVNNIISMAEENLGNRSAGVLNSIFNENIFEWNVEDPESIDLNSEEIASILTERMLGLSIDELNNSKN